MSSLRGRWAVAAAAAVLVALGVPAAAESTPAPTPSSSARPASVGHLPTASWQLLAKVNDHRRARGLAPLKVDPQLAATARRWSQQMAASGKLSHNDSLFAASTRPRGMKMLGENVGYNFSVIAQHNAFLGSPGHRRNIDQAAFRVAGVAVWRDKNGHLWSTQVFGAPRR